jgi:hypothetical protein
MAKSTKGSSKTSSSVKVKLNSKKSHKGVHAKSKTSKNKKSKKYKKPSVGQG